MFSSVISNVTGTLTIQNAALCTVVSILIGLFIAFIYMVQGAYSKSLVLTLVMLPVLVQLIIMMVNGNLGTSVAILGTFGLVRFRSMPGNARDICCIFFAMAIGLATGMGFLTFAVFMAVVIGGLFLILVKLGFGMGQSSWRDLRVTIPESLDYTGIFDDLFKVYLDQCSLEQVKTTNLGSMYELRYHVKFKDKSKEKELIDALRCRNGNLTIICGKIGNEKEAL